MKRRGDEEPVPPERSQTVRQAIIEHLRDGPVSIGELSGEVGLSEKQITEHLESLRRQVKLEIEPPRCGKCGFEFRDRRRAGKPGKCPECRGTYIEAPRFWIQGE